jgi:hypothetical protein
MGVIRAARTVHCRRHRHDAILGLHRRRAAPHAARVGHHNALAECTMGVQSMIHQTTVATPDTEVEDRSMRLVEWALALIAAIAAGVLAFIR